MYRLETGYKSKLSFCPYSKLADGIPVFIFYSPMLLCTVLVALLPILAIMAGSFKLGADEIDRWKFGAVEVGAKLLLLLLLAKLLLLPLTELGGEVTTPPRDLMLLLLPFKLLLRAVDVA